MSAKENAACRKFQANIFNHSKCQNCFKSRESHLSSDQDLTQAKPIYGGWLLLAPEGTDFENPVQRSRKWQRRFFLLYEHGLLRYALDDSPSTLPQGTINMNLSTDVTDGESKTAQKNSLCIVTPEKHHFIRAESKETINGWFEMLIVYPRTNKQNMKKKRKVEPPTPQEPGPAKVAVTSSSIPTAEKVPSTRSTLWQEQEELKNKELRVISPTMKSPSENQSSIVPSSEPPAGLKEAQSVVDVNEVDSQQKKRVESGYFSLEKLKSETKQLITPPRSSITSRYSSSESCMVIPCHSTLYSDPFPSPGNLYCSSSCVSPSQSSFDSETSGATLSSIASSSSRVGEGSSHSPATRINLDYAKMADVPKAKRISDKQAFQANKDQEQRFRTCSPGRAELTRLFGTERRRSQVIEQFETLEMKRAQQMASSSPSETDFHTIRCRGRSEKRTFPRQRDFGSESDQISSTPDVSAVTVPQYRRAKSLDRRASESTVTPDLLNFKKGWMTKLSADGQWKKHWFVLTDQVLKYYRDSAAEETVDLDGEIDLSNCYDVTEYGVPRNYGFQIHTKAKVYTLSAMTSGIRRNWIEAIMKNVHPVTTPDVTRSIPEEKMKGRILFEGASVNGEKPAVTSKDRPNLEAEPKKSRAWERRKEGRSKTFDWAEFRPVQQRPSGGRVHRPTSMYVRDMANPATDSQELEKDRARRREERRRRFEMTDVSLSPGYNDANRMEVDGATTTTVSPGPKSVDVEIEHRWQQVECTPLREEKQVPILTTQTSSEGRPPAQDLILILEKELEQSHQAVFRLHEQNKELQGQLRAALEREHNARDGYVLQLKGIPSPPSARQRLQKLNQDLQNEFIAQYQHQALASQQLQTLKRNNEEANDIIRKQEMEIQKLQEQISSTVSEGAGNEQAITKQNMELPTANKWIQQQWKEWKQKEKTMRIQLKNSEGRPYVTENLGELVKQQTLHKGFQDGLSDISEFCAKEQERLQKTYGILKQTYEKEEEIQSQKVMNAEEKPVQPADIQLMERPEKDMTAGTTENYHVMHQLEKKMTIQTLSQCLKEVRNEREKLKCRCEELVNQLMLADTENAMLQNQHAEFQTLENSYEKLSAVYQLTLKMLEEKSTELKEAREEHKNLIATKDRKLNEALVKLTALGSSLEEAEKKLQAKEAALQKFCFASSNTNSVNDGEDFQFKLNTARCDIIELEQKLNALQLENEELELENENLKDELKVSENIQHQQYKELMKIIEELKSQLNSSDTRAGETKSSVSENVKLKPVAYSCLNRQRIRFSSIHCQKYSPEDRSEKLWVNNTSNITLGGCCSKENIPPDAPAHGEPAEAEAQLHDSVVHLLEHKLNASEAKNDINLKLEEQQCRSAEHSKLVTTEVKLPDNVSKTDPLIMQLQVEKAQRWKLVQDTSSQLRLMQPKYDQVCSLIDTCKQNIWCHLGDKTDPNKDHFSNLLEMKSGLVDASHCLEQVEIFLQQQLKELREIEDHICRNSADGIVPLQEQFLLTREKEFSQLLKISDENKLKLFADKLVFEAEILGKMSQALLNKDSDIVQSLESLSKEAGILSSNFPALNMVREPSSPADFADILLRKTISDGEFWIEVEKLRKNIQPEETVEEKRVDIDAGFINEFVTGAADNASLKAELAFTVQKIQETFRAKVGKLEDDIQDALQEIAYKDNMLREVLLASKTDEVNKVMQQLFGECENPTVPEGKVINVEEPELLSHAKQIKREEARSLALNVVDKQLRKHLSENKMEWDFSGTVREELAEQLRQRAIVLRQLSEDLQALTFEKSSKICQKLQEVSEVLSSYIYMRNINNYASVLVQEAMIQAQITYLVCRIRTEHEKELKIYKDSSNNIDSLCQEHAKNLASVREKYEEILKREWNDYSLTLAELEKENETLRRQASLHISELELKQKELQELEERYKHHPLQIEAGFLLPLGSNPINMEEMMKQRMTDQNWEQKHRKPVRKLEESLQHNTQEHLIMHEEEKRNQYEQQIHDLGDSFEHQKENSEMVYHQNFSTQNSDCDGADGLSNTIEVGRNLQHVEKQAELESMTVLHDRIHELEAQMDMMRDELGQKHKDGPIADLREKYQRDLDKLKETCERGFTAMEESHQKVIEELQKQHQNELEKLQKEKDRLLAEETAATIAAIEAMKNAHREELERELEKTHRSQISGMNADIEALGRQHKEEMGSVQRELQVLSEQYSHKCLENSHLAQALEAERQALRQCQRENQEINARNQELNNRLAAEFARLRALVTEEGKGEDAGSPLSLGKDVYELEVLLRVKESEIQYLKQEINSLKDELQIALRDKKYATDKYKSIYTELSIVRAKADCDVNRLKEQLKTATEALGEKTIDCCVTSYDIMKSKSNPDFLKNDKPNSRRPVRTLRSKSLKEGLTVQERMKLFEPKD
ncbi:protein outspread-like isoform X2 [Stegostoma tigrinum]|uniref:protein outspread-like isoform X2 n=1 Tax=Stegostoma tigrinum TaxID=3053191 RepID=UPI002870405D|nr:protein outspread-like isoform X2 [Stegostoma tigrinum]